MSLQMSLGDKLLAAELAAERALPWVGPHVGLEISCFAEFLQTAEMWTQQRFGLIFYPRSFLNQDYRAIELFGLILTLTLVVGISKAESEIRDQIPGLFDWFNRLEFWVSQVILRSFWVALKKIKDNLDLHRVILWETGSKASFSWAIFHSGWPDSLRSRVCTTVLLDRLTLISRRSQLAKTDKLRKLIYASFCLSWFELTLARTFERSSTSSALSFILILWLMNIT